MGFKTSFEEDEAYLLVDVSYIVYAMAFRTLNIYKRHYDVPTDGAELYKIDFSLDEDFMGIFKRNFVGLLNKFMRKYFVSKSRLVLAIDCKKKDIWRKSIFPEYKLHRMEENKVPEGLRCGPIFVQVLDNLIPSLRDRDFGQSFKHPLSEGDDIIAISKDIIRKREPNRLIVILGSDHDLMQLIDDNTIITTTQEEIVNKKTIGTPSEDLLLKILQGDGSDGIPGVFEKVKGDKDLCRGFGKKTAMKFMEDRELLKRKFKEYPESVVKFKRNEQIINFKNIPSEIREDMTNKIEGALYG